MLIEVILKKRNLTLAEIHSKFSDEKRAMERGDPWLFFVGRPISFYPTWLFLRLGISANKTTLMVAISGIIGCVFLAFGSYWAIVAGAILINISFLFDVIDGNVARCTDSCSLYGAYIDKISDALVLALTPIAIGIGLYNHPDPYLDYLSNLFFGMGVSNNFYILLGMTYSFFYIFRFFVAAAIPPRFSIKPRDFFKTKTGAERGAWGIISSFGFCLQGNGKAMIILVAAIANILSVFIAIWTVITLCDLIIVVYGTLTLIKKREMDEAVEGKNQG